MPIADTPGSWSPTIYAGATWTYLIQLSPVVDVTGWDARLKARDSYTGDVAISMGTADGTIVLGGTAGNVTLTLSATATAALGSAAANATMQYVYDLELVDGTDVTRLLEGIITLKPEATR